MANEKPDAYLTKDLKNNFRYLFFGKVGDYTEVAIVIPKIDVVDPVKIRKGGTYEKGGAFFIVQSENGITQFDFKDKNEADYHRNELLIQIENYYCKE